MRIPVVIKPDKRDKKRVNYYVGNLSIYTTGKETVINVVPMYNTNDERGTAFKFITIPQVIKKDDIKAFMFNDNGCTVITTNIATVGEIELTYYTMIDKIVMKFTDYHNSKIRMLIMYLKNGECIITTDKNHYKFNSDNKTWNRII